MGWVAVRVLLAIAATLLGGWIGFTVSDSSPVVAALTGAGCAAKYWSEESGRWEKKAEKG